MKRYEQETVVVFSPDEEWVRIYSTYPPHIRKIVGNEFTTVVKRDWESLEALIPKDRFNIMRGFKPIRKEMSQEQRDAAIERLAAAREKREAENDA